MTGVKMERDFSEIINQHVKVVHKDELFISILVLFKCSTSKKYFVKFIKSLGRFRLN